MTQSRTRRRIQSQPSSESRIGKGCLIWGGVLGIVVGAAFAYYGLKPILKHFYGETTIAAHATYRGSNEQLTVTSLVTSDQAHSSSCLPGLPGAKSADVLCVSLQVRSDHDPGFTASDFSLEITDQHDWLKAAGIAGPDVSPVVYKSDEPVDLSIRFPASIDGKPIHPEYLHLTSPRLRFALK